MTQQKWSWATVNIALVCVVNSRSHVFANGESCTCCAAWVFFMNHEENKSIGLLFWFGIAVVVGCGHEHVSCWQWSTLLGPYKIQVCSPQFQHIWTVSSSTARISCIIPPKHSIWVVTKDPGQLTVNSTPLPVYPLPPHGRLKLSCATMPPLHTRKHAVAGHHNAMQELTPAPL